MIACQGYVPNPAASPPTTLLRLILGLPHVGSLITGPNLMSCNLENFSCRYWRNFQSEENQPSPRIPFAESAAEDRVLGKVDGPAVLDVSGLRREGLGEALAADEEAAAVVGDVAAAEPARGAHLTTVTRDWSWT